MKNNQWMTLAWLTFIIVSFALWIRWPSIQETTLPWLTFIIAIFVFWTGWSSIKVMTLPWLTFIIVSVALLAIFLYAPVEREEGIIQKIMYFHIPSILTAFFAYFIVFVTSIIFLWKQEREWDIIALSAAEIGTIFCAINLITGPIWAKPVWGTWWVWDARLTLTLILFLIYIAYIMLRQHSEKGSMRARYAAILGIIGFLDIPFIHFAVLWWRTIHPKPKLISTQGVGSGMDQSMLITLLISITAFLFMFFSLMQQRIKLERLEDEIDALKDSE